MFSLKIYDNDFESYRKLKSAQELRRAVDTLPDLSDAVEGEYSKEPVIFVTSALEWEERHDIVDERLLEALPGGRTTYRLTPQHFAWLHSRMSNAQAAYSAGRLGDEQWNGMKCGVDLIVCKNGRLTCSARTRCSRHCGHSA